MAKMIMIEVMSIAHAKIGMRRSDMPGARILRITTAMSTATMRPMDSVKLITMFQKSARLPMPYSGPASGTYSNQPASAPLPDANAMKKMTAPRT